MDTVYDPRREIDDMRRLIEDSLLTIGLDSAFRSLDATDSSSGKIEVVPGVTAERSKFGFDIPLDDDDDSFEQSLYWSIEHLLDTMSRTAYRPITDEVSRTVPFVTQARDTITGAGSDGEPIDPVLVLPNYVETTIGIPGATTLAFDERSMSPHTGLYVDRERFGFRVDWTPVEVLEYEEHAADEVIRHARLRRDYVVTHPDAGVWVDFSHE